MTQAPALLHLHQDSSKPINSALLCASFYSSRSKISVLVPYQEAKDTTYLALQVSHASSCVLLETPNHSAMEGHQSDTCWRGNINTVWSVRPSSPLWLPHLKCLLLLLLGTWYLTSYKLSFAKKWLKPLNQKKKTKNKAYMRP